MGAALPNANGHLLRGKDLPQARVLSRLQINVVQINPALSVAAQVYWNERERKLIDNSLIKKISLAQRRFCKSVIC
jgi:hypothetical protein